VTEGTSGGEEGETLLQSEIRPQRHRAVKIACPSFPVCSKVGNCCQWCRLRTHSARTGITHPTLCGGSHNPVYDGCTRNSSIMTPVLRRTRPAHAQQRLFWRATRARGRLPGRRCQHLFKCGETCGARKRLHKLLQFHMLRLRPPCVRVRHWRLSGVQSNACRRSRLSTGLTCQVANKRGRESERGELMQRLSQSALGRLWGGGGGAACARLSTQARSVHKHRRTSAARAPHDADNTSTRRISACMPLSVPASGIVPALRGGRRGPGRGREPPSPSGRWREAGAAFDS